MKKNKTYFLVGIVMTGFYILCVSRVFAEAEQLENRQRLIDNKLNCLQQNYSKENNPAWVDVCLTDVPTPKDDGRQELIERELNSVSRRINQQNNLLRENLEIEKQTDTVEETATPSLDKQTDFERTYPQVDIEEYSDSEDDYDLKKEYENDLNSKNVRDRAKKTEFGIQFTNYSYKADPYWPSYYALSYDVANEAEKSGRFFGAWLSYTYRRPYKVPIHKLKDLKEENGGPGYPFTFYRIETDLGFGSMKYKAHIPGKRSGFGAWRTDTRLIGGYDLQNKDLSFMATPYIGIGYKRFMDKAGSWIDVWAQDYLPYEKTYQFFYVPLGVETLKHFNERWDIGLRAEVSFLLVGSVAFGMSDIQGTFPGIDVETGDPINVSFQDVDSEFKNGIGFKTSFKAIRKYEMINLFFEPFFEFWYFGQSKKVEVRTIEVNTGVYYRTANPDGSPYQDTFEPSNYMFSSGLRAGIQF